MINEQRKKDQELGEKQIINEVPDTLDQRIWPEIEKDIENKKEIHKEFTIQNTNRAVGTRISYYLYKNSLSFRFLIFAPFVGTALMTCWTYILCT